MLISMSIVLAALCCIAAVGAARSDDTWLCGGRSIEIDAKQTEVLHTVGS